MQLVRKPTALAAAKAIPPKGIGRFVSLWKQRLVSSLALVFLPFCCWPAACEEPASNRAPLSAECRFTFGPLGHMRPNHFLLGETLFGNLAISGIAADEGMPVRCAIALEMLDQEGNVVFEGPFREFSSGELVFGGSKFIAAFTFPCPAEQAPGKFALRAKVKDLRSGHETSDTVELSWLAKDAFGAMHIKTTLDPQGQFAVGRTAIQGEKCNLTFALSGYAVEKGQYELAYSIGIQDSQGNPLGQPRRQTTTGFVSKWGTPHPVPQGYSLPLHRDGRFTLILKVEDVLGHKTTTYKIPVHVLPLFEDAL